MAQATSVVTMISYLLHIACSLIHMYSNGPIIELSKGITYFIFRYYEWKCKFILWNIVKAAKYGCQLCDTFVS